MLCKLFLLLVGIFMGTLGYYIPGGLKTMSTATHNDYRVYENPFFIYVNFTALAENCEKYPALLGASFHGHCLCYYGFVPPSVKDPVELDILKKHLSAKEAQMFEWHRHGNNFEYDGSKPLVNVGNCSHTLKGDTPSIYDYNNPLDSKGDDNEKAKRYHMLHKGYAGKKFAPQKVCVSAEAQSKDSVKWYDITIHTSGNGIEMNPHTVKITRMESQGYLQLQFNTKMGVLQIFGETANKPNRFFVIPQIAPIQGFDSEQETKTKDIIEDTFVQFEYHTCGTADTHGVFFYSESELKSTDFVDRPPTLESYIGVKLLPNGPSVGEMVPRNETEAEDILYKEMLDFIQKREL